MKLPVIISAVAVLSTLAGGMYALDRTYAREEKLCRVEQRLDRKILSDDANRWLQMMFQLEDRYGKEKAEQLPEYREFERQREKALRELQR
jgi:hypothetical protein